MNCKNCKKQGCFLAGKNHEMSFECNLYVGKTNADRIRGMTDEELAEWFYSGDFPWCNFEEDVVPCPYEEMPDPCEHCLLGWLREEAKE